MILEEVRKAKIDVQKQIQHNHHMNAYSAAKVKVLRVLYITCHVFVLILVLW